LTTVFVGNLSREVTDSDLRELFGAYGKVGSIRMIRRRGLAFVELKPEAAAAALEAVRGTELKGRRLDVAVDDSPGGGRPRSRRPRGGLRRRR
jgi:RNA recognition motif-containing protein